MSSPDNPNHDLTFRDRLMMLADVSAGHRPFNVKRKTGSVKTTSGGKMTMQDFVRMDPGYTPNIEHLVFPTPRRSNTQEASPVSAASKTRSRLAEMFALSKHLQQSNVERGSKTRTVNRSVDSAREAFDGRSSSRNVDPRRWIYNRPQPLQQQQQQHEDLLRRHREEPVRQTLQNQRILVSQNADAVTGTSVDSWESTSSFEKVTPRIPGPNQRIYPARNQFQGRQQHAQPIGSNFGHHMTKHLSLSGATPSAVMKTSARNPKSYQKWNSLSSDDPKKDFVTDSRELSPVRWCDTEVDGVYLGRSGWVQVQHRSLDENKSRIIKPPLTKKSTIKPIDYHTKSEPISFDESTPQIYVPFKEKDLKKLQKLESVQIRTYSPPPENSPIISPPPAFQDGGNQADEVPRVSPRRQFFSGKTHFLPRFEAIDSDMSPPKSPPNVANPPKKEWTTLAPMAPNLQRSPVVSPDRRNDGRRLSVAPQQHQVRSLESAMGATNVKRNRFFNQKYSESSSSTSSSSFQGFRSLDSSVTRPTMPRLSENTDSSVELYEDADDEDNNSSSLNFSMQGHSLSLDYEQSKIVTKRTVTQRKSPVPEVKTTFSSSSTESVDIPIKNSAGMTPPSRRSPSSRHLRVPQDDETLTKVKRSRSLQLPENKLPNFPQRGLSPVGGKDGRRPSMAKPKSLESTLLDDEVKKEAEFVTEFLFSERSKAAAQALLMQKLKSGNNAKEDVKDLKQSPVAVYYVGDTVTTSPVKYSDSYWPHYSSREIKRDDSLQLYKKPSPTYTTNKQQSFDSRMDMSKRILDKDKKPFAKLIPNPIGPSIRRTTPVPTDLFRERLTPTKELKVNEPLEIKISPIVPSKNFGSNRDNPSNSSSSSDIWLTTSDRTVVKCQGLNVPSAKNSGQSTPLGGLTSPEDDGATVREAFMPRPGSAPGRGSDADKDFDDLEQRSMSLPKSLPTISKGEYKETQQHPRTESISSAIYQEIDGKLGTPTRKISGSDSLGSSPGSKRKFISTELSHTAPVTPLHDGRRPSVETSRKSSSTPLLLDTEKSEPKLTNPRKWSDLENDLASIPRSRDPSPRKTISASPAESMLQKFKKSFTQRFQRKSSKDLGGTPSEFPPVIRERFSLDTTEENEDAKAAAYLHKQMSLKEDQSEQKYKFGPLVWRSSKEKKRISKTARSIKCNSGDSGIQVEMAAGCAGGSSGDGASPASGEPFSDDESASGGGDTDGGPAGDESDGAAAATGRRGRPHRGQDRARVRPNSELLNQILIDKFKAELKQRAYRNRQVRRTRSDLGGQTRAAPYRRQMSSPSPIRHSPMRPPTSTRPPMRQSPRSAAGGAPLRRSLSQPIDIDKLSPLMRPKMIAQNAVSSRGSSALSEDEHEPCLRKGRTLDDDLLSDSESSSVTSLTDQRKRSLDTVASIDQAAEISVLAEAVFDHVAIDAEELAFRAGDVIEVLETEHRDWWWGTANGKTGWFPAHFVRLRVSQEDTVEDCLEAMVAGKSVTSHRRRTSISLLSNDQVRSSVVRELVQTERDFVKVLRDVTEGYIVECRKRVDMFNEDQIRTIFSNIEEILRFQSKFLNDLENKIDWENPYKSCIGECFLKHKQGFEMYSDYCNSHPAANVLLQELYQFNSYSKFFEACRLMRGLIEIPLDGYLLTPIQRICKYPLQLAELLKYTKKEHEDYEKIREALETMRGVALFINERKRKVESLEKLALWQQRVEGWEGEDLIEDSTQLIYQGDVVRVTSGMWTSNITLFLFDHQIVYCKKDLLKRNTYIYKGRICLDTSEVIDVSDGKDVHTGVTVRHAVKIYSCVRDKWLLFYCRSASAKERWLRAFQEERKIVTRDKEDGVQIPLSTKQLARMTTHCLKRHPRKPRGKRYENHGMVGSSLQLNTAGSQNTYSLGRKMGLPWFSFGGGKRTNVRHRHHRGTDSAS